MALSLKGLLVFEASALVAGPAMGSLLQGLGAEVIKIEQPGSGDPSRSVSPWGFLNYNSGKQSLSLNLKSAKGQQILHQLVDKKKPDVFIENMGANVSRRLGFSYSSLRKLNPRLIYCSIKGFSSKSSYFDKPAFDAVAQAMSGMMSLTGEPEGEPVRIGNPSIDLGAAAYGTIEVLSAILDRQKSGKGKFLEVSLLDMSVYWNGYWLTYYGITGRVPRRLGSGHLGYSPHKAFKTRDEKYVLIATLSDAQWKLLTSQLGIRLSSEFDGMQFRLNHRNETEQSVQDAVSKLDAKELLDKIGRTVPCALVRSIDEIYHDEELYSLGVTRNIRNYSVKGDRSSKAVRIVSLPIKTSRKPAQFVPILGQNNERILKSIGYSQAEISKLTDSGTL